MTARQFQIVCTKGAWDLNIVNLRYNALNIVIFENFRLWLKIHVNSINQRSVAFLSASTKLEMLHQRNENFCINKTNVSHQYLAEAENVVETGVE